MVSSETGVGNNGEKAVFPPTNKSFYLGNDRRYILLATMKA